MKRRTRAILMIVAAGIVSAVCFAVFSRPALTEEPCIYYQGKCIDIRVLMTPSPRHLLP
ncbi:hypothetical protein B0G57_10110 [Trinickia symbiotica]|nr:hypothetical protein B0G57_10110 [Trinickia symbiotica]